MSWLDDLQRAYGAASDVGFGPPTIDVEPDGWRPALLTAWDRLGCLFFDFLTAVDCLDEGFSVVAHVARPQVGRVDDILLRTQLPRDAPEISCVCDVYAGAGWHERETHEMFGIGFAGHDRLDTLLLPDGFEGNPLRKDFVLASRVAKAWPGAKDPGESDHDAAPSRRRTRPPGVPDPDSWPQATTDETV
jgi:NADH-quinone oxidoreductase subunit C